MAEYAACYGGLPDLSTPWPVFVALVERVDRFDMRGRLHATDAVSEGIGHAFGSSAELKLERDRLFRAAYPVVRRGPRVVVQNKEPGADG